MPGIPPPTFLGEIPRRISPRTLAMLQPKPARLPEPAATGLLAKKPLAHLLIYALDRKLNGTFELGDEKGASVHVVVERGMVARVGTSEPVTYLGHVLYENGFIDDGQLSAS